MTHDLLLKNVRPWGAAATDILIRDGKIEVIAQNQSAEVVPDEDCANGILLPGLVEAHTHLDKTLWGMGWRPHQAGPRLIDKIETERQLKTEWNIDPARQSKRQALLSLSHGSTAIRSHVDIDTEIGLEAVEGVLTTKQDLDDVIDIEIVAFPQSGLMSRPGTLDLMKEAMSSGAHVVGGLDPCGIDRDPKGQLDAIFGLADQTGKPIDIHLHEPDELGAFSMDMIIERTKALGMRGSVTISHAFCLGMSDRSRALGLIEQLAQEQISISTVATASRPVPLADDLRSAGVILCAGSDGIRDTWGPYGNADMLERAMLLGLRSNFRTDGDVEHALWCCSFGGAKVMKLLDYGLDVGCIADLVLVEAESVAHAVVSRPQRKLVIKRGKVVARDGITSIEAPDASA